MFLINLTSLFVHRGRLTFPLPAYVPHHAACPLRGMYHVDSERRLATMQAS